MGTAKDTAHQRLKELLADSDHAKPGWSEGGKQTEWERSVRAALRRMFGAESEHLTAFAHVRYSPMVFTTDTPDHVFDKCFMAGMDQARGIIRAAIREFIDYEFAPHTPEKASGDLPPGPSVGDSVARRAFIVHGHDNEMKESVARFLQQIDFEPVILHEQASGGDTVIEKFERNADVPFAVVLLSPDDIGANATAPKATQPRARQNVVLELGYFIGRLGRSHVCPLVRGKLDLPSDVHGVVYIPFDGDTWKIHLIKELKHLGFDIDANEAF